MRLPDVSSRRGRPIRHAAVCDFINLCCRWIFVTWRGQGAGDVSARCSRCPLTPIDPTAVRTIERAGYRLCATELCRDDVVTHPPTSPMTDVDVDLASQPRQPWSGLRKRLSGRRRQHRRTPTAASTFDGAVSGPVATDTGAYKLNGDRMLWPR